jgi:hypothetical protein
MNSKRFWAAGDAHTLTPIFSFTLACFSFICFSSFLIAAAYGAAPYVFSTWMSLLELCQPRNQLKTVKRGR